MMVRLFITSKRRLPVVINKLSNGLYVAYEARTRGDGGNVQIRQSWSLDWLVDTLHMHYIDEKLIQEI